MHVAYTDIITLSVLRVSPQNFNLYGSRRGNHEVMARGTFANTRLVNKMAAKGGPVALHLPSEEEARTITPSSDIIIQYFSIDA